MDPHPIKLFALSLTQRDAYKVAILVNYGITDGQSPAFIKVELSSYDRQIVAKIILCETNS